MKLSISSFYISKHSSPTYVDLAVQFKYWKWKEGGEGGGGGGE